DFIPSCLQFAQRVLAPHPPVGHLLGLRWAVRVAYVPQQAVDGSQFALELFLRFDPLEAFTEPQEARLPHAECSRPRRRDRSRAPADVSAPFLKEHPRMRYVVRGCVEVVGSGEDELHAAW